MKWTGILAVALSFLGQAISVCPGQKLLPIPSDPAARGPWPVGSTTVTITARNLTVEIWYPAVVGSEIGKKPVQYSVRDEWLPPFQARKIPDSEDPIQYIDSYESLPLDSTHGPYPVHLHVHGTAAWRTASAHQMTHYASRGFVVVSADHPGIFLYDMLRFQFGADQEGDARLIIDELKNIQDPQLQFLKGHADTSKISLSGHSAGGGAVGAMADVGNVVMPWCAWGVQPASFVQSSLVLGGIEDSIARYTGQQNGYATSPVPKRLVGIERAGHMVVTDICFIGKEYGGIVEIAKRNGIYLAYLFGPLGEDGCDEGQVKDELAWEIVNYATAAAQEEVLHCNPEMTSALSNIQKAFTEVGEYLEQLK